MDDWIQVAHWPAMGEVSPLLMLGCLLIFGGLAGQVARRFKVPAITGNILAGVLLGPSILDIFHGQPVAQTFETLSSFAMGIIAVAVGGQLSYRRIHNALRRILVISIAEVMGAMILVYFTARWLGADEPVCILLAIIAAATAPATTVALVRESRAKGSFVKTLLSVVALDNILCVICFAFGKTLLSHYYADGAVNLAAGMNDVCWQLGGAVVIGFLLGRLTEMLGHRSQLLNWSDFSLVFVGVALCTGLGVGLQVSPLLTCLFYGVYLGNASDESERQIKALLPIEHLLFIAFFTIAGASLHLDKLGEVGIICVGYIVARMVGKGLGSMAGGWVARSSNRIWTNMPLALVPQAGLAIGLVVLLEGDPYIDAAVKEQVAVLVLAAVTINEIVGPLMTRSALRRAKEAGLDRPRLIEFIQEEYIVTKLTAADKWEALEKMTQFFERSHRVKASKRSSLRDSVREREEQMSTSVGQGVAIPHGRVDTGEAIQGVLGILEEGVDWGAIDGQPVRLIMLVMTPKDHEAKHLDVMASLAAMCSDDLVRNHLFAARDSNDAWEIIENEETPNYNYFIEEGGESDT